MLKKLKVQNYALIQNLDIDFNNDFSTLTGETGAGKSILLGALSLVLGGRADSTALKNNDDKCVVEATFEIANYNLLPFFTQNDLDYAHDTILRREITPNGKSRAFVNDTPVNLTILKDLAVQLIDIHSQHESLELNDNKFQLKVIDALAGNTPQLLEYSKAFQQYKSLQAELDQLNEQTKLAHSELDYNQFQFNQLNDLKLENIDLPLLEEELEILNNAEEIQQNLTTSFQVLSEGEINVMSQLKLVKQSLSRISSFFHKAEELNHRIESVSIEIADINQEVESAADRIEFNPNRASELKALLDIINEALHKHKVETINALIEVRNTYKQKIEKFNGTADEILALENKLTNLKAKIETDCTLLHENREKAAIAFVKKIIPQLMELGMPYAQFSVLVEKTPQFMADGADRVNFLFSANKNIEVQNISKIASGGEISRLMLSIKAILSESTALPTIIFDEIDTGVSGEIADKMAQIMLKMAENMQVISITHLPQIAAKGQNHYKVFKNETNHSIQTNIIKLNSKERVEEIARLLSGKNISIEAIENAKMLMNINN